MRKTKLKILNLYSGIGGNRKQWEGHSIVAVENDLRIADCYLDNFPDDEMVIQDVIEFIEENDLSRFDFIWASPPCLTHSQWNMVNGPKVPRVTDIYGLILFFNHTRQDPWIIENVNPWYKTLIPNDFQVGRHYFWSNFSMPSKLFGPSKMNFKSFRQLSVEYGLNVQKIEKLTKLRRRQIVRNCVHPDIGKYIFQNLTGEKRLTEYFT